MNTRWRHPSLDDWKSYLELSSEDVRARKLHAHLQGCRGCAGLVEVLRSVRGELGKEPWRTPDPELVRRAGRLPKKLRPAPDVRRPLPLSWDAVDVRGTGSGTVEEGRIVARSCPGADLSIVVLPPRGEHLWVVEGRIWLRRPVGSRILLVFTQGDHVVRQEEVDDGEHFRIEELVGPGWTLEIHLPAGDTILLHDPFTADPLT
jgi:hypothetical protein